jgi:CubicO group peptidase (beta-lactamase class C family)
MRSTLRLVSLFLLTCAFVVRLAAAPASPELAAKIDRLFAKWDRPDAPGLVVAIARDGETIFSRGFGRANLEHNMPLTPETVTESGSVAKQFTAAALVLLAERGRLSLDDSIRKHLPEMPAALAERITVRMLLNHTSGLRDIHGLFDLIGRPSYSASHDNAEVVRVMSRQRDLNFAPGTEYLYCNAAYILAAVIVERVSKQTFGAFSTEHIFRPRGMTHTRWRDDFTTVIAARATGYSPRAGGGYAIDTPYSNLVGNGGLLTTAGDLLKWNASLDSATGEWGAVVRALQTPSKLSDGREIDYGLGLTIAEVGGVKEISHGGSTSGYKTFLARFPERRVSFALLANAGDFNPSPAAHALTRLLLDLPAPPAPKRIDITPVDLAALAGMYHASRTDDLLRLTVREGKLFGDGGELVPVGPGRFTSSSGSTTFSFANETPRRLQIISRNATVDYRAVAVVKPSSAELAVYAGTYRSAELDVTRVITVKAGRLSVGRWPAPALTAEPTFADGFVFGGGWHATFTRDTGGGIAGYELTNGRCRRVKFSRQ